MSCWRQGAILLLVGVLASTPAAAVCGASSAHCPMAVEKADPVPSSPCHQGAETSHDCCGMGSAPEPIGSPAVEKVQPVLGSSMTVSPLASAPPVASATVDTAPDPAAFHTPDRYLLFSTYLL
jgi:hypothetical protein